MEDILRPAKTYHTFLYCRLDGSCQGCMIYTNLGQQFFHIGEVFQLFVGQIKCSLIEAEYVHSGSVMILTSSN